LKASFHKNQISGQDVIEVKIQDQTKILRQTFIPPMKEKLQHKRDPLKENEIIYYYIEPNNIRNIESSGNFNLIKTHILVLLFKEVELRVLHILEHIKL
jgi:hypothetical protein